METPTIPPVTPDQQLVLVESVFDGQTLLMTSDELEHAQGLGWSPIATAPPETPVETTRPWTERERETLGALLTVPAPLRPLVGDPFAGFPTEDDEDDEDLVERRLDRALTAIDMLQTELGGTDPLLVQAAALLREAVARRAIVIPSTGQRVA